MSLEGRPELGRFRVRSRIGSGGMGEVYLATAPGPRGVEKLVAVKLIRGLDEQDREIVEMFIEEAKVSFLLTHPNIVQTYEIGQIDGHYFLVMEYVDGITLSLLLYHFRDKLRQPMPTPFALYVAAQVARGLDYAHKLTDQDGHPLGIVHRDVSPSNVLLSRDGQVKVSDFGLAISALREFESQSGEVKGKAPYMAPEQVDARPVDARADIFALGVVLYEMLSGRNPFAPKRRDVTIASRIRGMAIHPFGEVAGHVPTSVVQLVDHCLALEPEGRFASAREVGRALEACLSQLGLPVSSYDFADFVAQARSAASAKPAPAHPFDRALGMVIQLVEGMPAGAASQALPEAPARGVKRYITMPPDARADQIDPAGAPTITDLSRMIERPTASTAAAIAAAEPVSEVAAEASKSLQPARQAWRAWLPAGALLVILGAALLLVLGLRSSSHVPTGGRGAASGAASGSAARAARGGVRDARPPAPRDALALSSAAAADGKPSQPRLTAGGSAAVRGARRHAVVKPAARASGFLSVNTEPWSNVIVDGTAVQSTPLVRYRLSVGTHRVLLVNPGRSLRAERRVTIRAGQVTELVVELKP